MVFPERVICKIYSYINKYVAIRIHNSHFFNLYLKCILDFYAQENITYYMSTIQMLACS